MYGDGAIRARKMDLKETNRKLGGHPTVHVCPSEE